MTSTTKLQRVCTCCGAHEGENHHDEGYRHLLVVLTRSRTRKRLECQLCRKGLRQLAKEGEKALSEVEHLQVAAREATRAKDWDAQKRAIEHLEKIWTDHRAAMAFYIELEQMHNERTGR